MRTTGITAWKILLLLLLCATSFPFFLASSHSSYEEYLRRYKAYKRMYYGQYRPHRVKGMCQPSPHWLPLNATHNPVHERVREGYVVVLAMGPGAKDFHALNHLSIPAQKKDL